MTAIRVLLVDDHPLFRQGVAFTLNREPDIDVVGEAASGKQALALARSLVPDVILLDITMPEGDGLVTAAQVGQELPTVRVIMLTASEEGDDLVMAMKVGARVRCQGGRCRRSSGCRTCRRCRRCLHHTQNGRQPAA